MAKGNKYNSKDYKSWTRSHEKSSHNVHGTDGPPSDSNSKDTSELSAIEGDGAAIKNSESQNDLETESKDRYKDSNTKEDVLYSKEYIPESALCADSHHVYGAVGGPSDNIDPSKLSWTCTAHCQEDEVVAIRNSKSQNDLETDSERLCKVSDSQEKVLPSGGSSHQDDVSSLWDVVRSKRVFSNGNEDTQPWPEDTTPSVPYYEKTLPESTCIQLSGAVNRETTIVSEETESPVYGDFVPVVSAQHTSQNIRNLLPSSKDRCGVSLGEVTVQPTRGIHEQRLVAKDACQNCGGQGFHPTVAHDFNSHEKKQKTVWRLCRTRVGHVKCSRCGYLGTSFRIGTCDVVTCFHVIKACMDMGHEIKVEFYRINQAQDEKNTILYQMTEKFHDEVLDFAVLELHDDGAGFPPAFNEFRKPSSTDGKHESLVYLVCFQKNSAGDSELIVDCGTVRLNADTFGEHLENANINVMEMFPHIKGEAPFGQAHLHKKNGSVPLLSHIKHGGSGGVGVFLDQSGNIVVDFMYRRGYPGMYYNKDNEGKPVLRDQERGQLEPCWKMELGLDFRKIIDHPSWQSLF